MTDARVRLIVLAVLLLILWAGTVAIYVLGRAVPTPLEGADATVLGVFLGHVYMNGTGGGTGGPGAK